jgi:hypothetical protein
MRMTTVAAVFGLSLFATSPSLAQFANPMVALSGGAGATRCGAFLRLGANGQDRLVRRLNAAAPPTTLAPLTIRPPRTGGNRQIQPNLPTGRAAGTPLTAGDLVAACQAVSSGATLRTAYSRFNSRFGNGVGD